MVFKAKISPHLISLFLLRPLWTPLNESLLALEAYKYFHFHHPLVAI